MSSQQDTLPDLERPTTEHGNPIPPHIDSTRTTHGRHHGRCTSCGKSIFISPSGIERGHDVRDECQWYQNQVGTGGPV